MVAGEPFQLDVAIEDQFGSPFNPPTAVTLTVLSHFSGVTLQATPVSAAPGVARFRAALDRKALGVILVAATAGLQAKSSPIDKGAILFASGADTSKVFGGVFRSDDRGKTYTQVKRGMTFELVTAGSSLVVPGEVSRTEDFGRTFTPLFSGHEFVKWVAASAQDPRVLIALEQPSPAVLPPALYRTGDGGATWTRCLSGLEHPNIFQVELDPADGTTLYAATDEGLFRSSNACPKGH